MDTEHFSALVEQAKNQDGEAITYLYEEFHNGVYFLCLKIVKNEDDALDLVQDSFLQAFGKLDTLQNPAQFGPWLNQIAANKCRDYLKKKKPVLFSQQQSSQEDDEEPEIEDRDESLIPDKALDTEETRRLVMGIIDGLPDLQRMTVMLYYYEEKSIKEIAEIMECSENTVKSRLNYARKQIKEGVLELEKKGTKLYGVMPMLFPIIRHAASDFTLPSGASSALLGNITFSLAPSAAQGTAESASAEAGHSAASQIAAGASGAVRNAMTRFSKRSLPAKIGAGVAAAAVAAGIWLGVSASVHRSVPVQAVPVSTPASSAAISSEIPSQGNSAVSSSASSAVSSASVSSMPEVIPVTGISLSKTKVALTVGQKTMPIVTMSPEDATDQGEIWTSSDERVAAVDQSGNIRAVGTGSCTVTVTSKSNPDVSKQVSVSVSKESSATSAQTTQDKATETTRDKATETIDVYAATGDTPATDYPFYDKSLTTISFSRLVNFSSVKSANYLLQFFKTTYTPGDVGAATGPWWTQSVQVSNSGMMKLVDQDNNPYCGLLYFQVIEKGSTSVTVQGEDGKTITVTVHIT